MARERQPFTPRAGAGNAVSMYVCGVTVYDLSHIGHARVYVAFDVLYRVLRHLGYDVQYVRNFTDIDDKIIRRAAESGEDPLALSARYIEEFRRDMLALGCDAPSAEPKATEHVADMVATVQRIIDNGCAYAVGGDVFFSVQAVEGYGRLSGQKLDASLAGACCRAGRLLRCTPLPQPLARLAACLPSVQRTCGDAHAGGSERVAVDERKRHPADFALWKSAKPGEPTWDSPWGPGRPGWHIECSAMIRALMGPVIDIHGGGSDLVRSVHVLEALQLCAA